MYSSWALAPFAVCSPVFSSSLLTSKGFVNVSLVIFPTGQSPSISSPVHILSLLAKKDAVDRMMKLSMRCDENFTLLHKVTIH